MSPNIKCLTPQEEERFLMTLRNRKDAQRAYMLYHLMLITGLRLSEALSLNVEHASRAKVELKVKGWTKNKPQGYGLVSDNQNHRPEGRGLASHSQSQNAKLVQRYLGHSDVATTLRYYVDVFPEDLEEAAETLTQK